MQNHSSWIEKLLPSRCILSAVDLHFAALHERFYATFAQKSVRRNYTSLSTMQIVENLARTAAATIVLAALVS